MKFDEIYSLGKKYYNFYAGRVYRDLYELGIHPLFELGKDKSAWTTTNRKGIQVVHIGLGMLDTFPDESPVCRNENDFHVVMRVLTGHEAGHQKYTTQRAFEDAINKGREGFVEYAYEHYTGRKPKIKKLSDCDGALQELVDNYDVYVDINMLNEVTHFIANAVEDGRMERCVSVEKPGFKNDVIFYRGNTWKHSPCSGEEDYNRPDQYLIAVLNQILSLSTMGVWQKGFLQYIAGTKVEFKVRELMPYIEAGVTSLSCANGMRNAKIIMEKLYPEMLDAFMIEDFKEKLQDFMDNVQKSLPDMDSNEQNGNSYNRHESGMNNGSGLGSTVKLPVNIFPKEQQEADGMQSGDSQSGARQRAGNGKSDGNSSNADDDTDSGSVNSSSQGSDDGSSKDGSETGTGGSESGQDGEGGSNGSEEGDGDKDTDKSDGDASSEDGSDNADESGNESNAAAGDDKDEASSLNHGNSSSSPNGPSKGGQSGSKGQDLKLEDACDEEAVLNAMEKAAVSADMNTQATMALVNAQADYFEHTPTTYDDTLAKDVLDQQTLDGLGYFNENMHTYEVSDDLPPDILQESLIVRRQYEQYFKSRKKPVRRNQRSGHFDSHQLSRLVRGETDIYRKDAKNDEFSGCIEILLDNSGSMDGLKKKFACETLARIEESLKGLVPIKIIAFDSWGSVNIEIIKNWNEVQRKNCSWNYFLKSRGGGGTPTTETLSIAREEMKKRAERHKMIVLLTDESARYASSNLPPAIQSIRKEGISLCAIYFEDRISESEARDFCELFGEKSSIVCPPAKIGENLLPVIQDFTRQ